MIDEEDHKEKLHYAASRGDLTEVMHLLKNGYPINAFDEGLFWTPLHHAAKENHIEIVKFLLANGADVNAHLAEKIGETPLSLVAESCSYDMGKTLIDAGANPNIEGWMKLTALHRAQKRKKPEGIRVYELLLDAAEKFKK